MGFSHQQKNAPQHIVTGDVHQALTNLQQFEIQILQSQTTIIPAPKEPSSLSGQIRQLFLQLRNAAFSN